MHIVRPVCLILFAVIMPVRALCADTYQLSKDIAYLGADRPEKLDVYQPPARYARPLPAVIWIHGGGWAGGDKAQKREVNICKALAEAGYVAISINYKLATKPAKTAKETQESETEGDAPAAPASASPAVAAKWTPPWPQNIHDCKTALRFIRKEARQWGVDPERIAVAGGSAGGQLALIVGMTAESRELNRGGLYLDQKSHVACIVDFYGASSVADARRRRMFAGSTPEETTANVALASPVTHVGPTTPPILVLHGAADGTVPVRFSRDFVTLLKKKGVKHEYVEIPGAPHSFDLQPKEQDLRPVFFAFLAKHLGAPRPR